MIEMYARYHGQVLARTRAATATGAWRSQLREILAELDGQRRLLQPLSDRVLRDELTQQIEHEALQLSDPDKRAVLTLALKHLDASG